MIVPVAPIVGSPIAGAWYQYTFATTRALETADNRED